MHVLQSFFILLKLYFIVLLITIGLLAIFISNLLLLLLGSKFKKWNFLLDLVLSLKLILFTSFKIYITLIVLV